MAIIELGLKTLPKVVVATAGTPVPLSATELLVIQATIQYNGLNAGDIYIGEADVTANKCLVLNGSTPALALEGEDTVADEDKVVFDLNKVYVDAANNGDSVFVAYTEFTGMRYNT